MVSTVVTIIPSNDGDMFIDIAACPPGYAVARGQFVIMPCLGSYHHHGRLDDWQHVAPPGV